MLVNYNTDNEKLTLYFPDGKILAESHKNNSYKIYTHDGNIVEEVNYKNDFKNGWERVISGNLRDYMKYNDINNVDFNINNTSLIYTFIRDEKLYDFGDSTTNIESFCIAEIYNYEKDGIDSKDTYFGQKFNNLFENKNIILYKSIKCDKIAE